MTDVMQDLLIDFDEMGFAPTTACPNPDKYACEWKEKLIAEITCLQERLEATIAGQEILQKALAEKNTEIERRKNNLFCKVVIDEEEMRNIINEKVAGLELDIELIKAEAIREFAERLKKECLIDRGYEILHEGTIDNLVKEMVGDTE